MKIPVILNGEHIVLDVSSDKMLLPVLRERGLLSVKCGCFNGHGTLKSRLCGACTVMLDGHPVPSCIVPVAIARDSEIVTLEYFCKSDAYTDIIKGFKIAGVKLCGFCDAGKIFAAEYLLRTGGDIGDTLRGTFPSLKTIHESISHLTPCCTSIKQLSEGIIHAFNNRVDREGENGPYSRKSARQRHGYGG